MNHIYKLIIVGLLLSISSTLSTITLAQDEEDDELSGDKPDVIEVIVTANTANLRSGPSTNYEIVGSASSGEKLLIYDEEPESPGWLRIYREDEGNAYIADFLVEEAPTRFYPPEQEPLVTVSGTGKQITDSVDLPQGAYRLDAFVQDNAFIFESIAVEGNCDDEILFNELDFDVKSLEISTLLISSGCTLIFESDNVSGSWDVEIRDLLDENYIVESSLEIEDGTTISSRGKQLTMLTLLPEGIWSINAVVNDRAFILRPQVLSGNCDGYSVFNEVDDAPLELSSVYRSESSDGNCLIFWETSNVEGNWEITFNEVG